jgi:hypothetical protein
MKRIIMSLALAGALMVAPLHAGDDVPIEQLPEPVRQAVEDRFPGAQFRSAERETDDGATYYEVEIVHQGREYEVDVTPEGRILDVEED